MGETKELEVEVYGDGEVVPAGGKYETGAKVRLKADPADDWEFAGWEGAGLDGTTATKIILVMDEDIFIKARFIKEVNDSPAILYDFEKEDEVNEELIEVKKNKQWEIMNDIEVTYDSGGKNNRKSLRVDFEMTTSDIKYMICLDKKYDLSEYSLLQVGVRHNREGKYPYTRLFIQTTADWNFQPSEGKKIAAEKTTPLVLNLNKLDDIDEVQNIGIEVWTNGVVKGIGTIYIDYIIVK